MRNFIRKTEDFVCSNCGFGVKGNGYTDHCPKCLWGKHVDLKIPGDRSADCKGLMEPVTAVYEKGDFRIFYRCNDCGHEFWVDCAKDDNREKLVGLLNR